MRVGTELCCTTLPTAPHLHLKQHVVILQYARFHVFHKSSLLLAMVLYVTLWYYVKCFMQLHRIISTADRCISTNISYFVLS